MRLTAGIALLFLGGALWADQPPALAISAGEESPRFNTVLGPEITLAEAQSRPEEQRAEASAEHNGALIVQLPPLPSAATPPAAAGGPVQATKAAQADPLPRGAALPAGPATVSPSPAPAPAAFVPPAPPPVTPPGSPSAETPASPLPRLAQPNPAEAIPLELELLSNQQAYDAQLERFVSTGNVSAKIAGGRLQADRIEFDPDTRTLHAVGAVRFQRGQQFFQASRLRYSLLEGMGELDDVYGVLDLDGSAQDLDLTQPPSTPLPPPEPFSCPPSLPPIPEWHPYPWAVTGWAGQMTTANFGDAFLFNGSSRPEYLMGLGVQRRLIHGGPLSLELDANLLGHQARRQAGGPYNQAVPYAPTPAQTFGEVTLGIGARLWLRPWLNIFFEEGVSLLTESSNWERTERENYSTLLNYLAFEVEGLVTPEWSIVGRIHHRSGAYGVYSGVREGSNGYLLGVRHRFGTVEKPRATAPMPAPQGCPGAPLPDSKPRDDLASQLEAVTMGVESQPGALPAPATVAPPAPPRRGTVWTRANQAERQRQEAIARVDQRVKDVTFQQSLTAERRYGFPSQFDVKESETQYGQVRPGQLNPLTSKDNRPLIRGTISRWRVQASQLVLTPTTFSGERVAFSNDPFTPAQSWLDSEGVVATLQPNGDTVIKAGRNEVVLEDRLRIPARRQTVVKKQEEVDNPWVIGVDREDRDGVFLGYNTRFRIGERGQLTLQPQLLVERAIDGQSDSYPYPWQSAGADAQKQPATTGDDFGLLARLQTNVFGFETNARLDLSTFNPDNISNGTRSLAELTRDVQLPWVGISQLRLFGAYRFRTWNGTLGEQDVYSAFGGFLEKKASLPNWGRLSSNYLWRMGVGNYQGDDDNTTNLSTLWRANAIGSLNFSYPLWTGEAAPSTPLQGLANTAQPVVPGLSLNANLQGVLAYYGDGTNQNTASISGGPTLTLGHFVKPFLDYTQITITGGGTLRQGQSPFGFDRAVDLGTLGFGLTQQIVGPLVFNGGVGLNVDPKSENYGEVTGSYLEVRWQRRSYEVGIFYSPYDGLGGLRVRLNDLNFSGPGVPFVPLTPSQAIEQRPF
ncbi:MAG: DUF3769 domain-containing protein [Cyanobacteriota bacterium]|nr:DUF3769 domain-containing protein [Cyanobacteriota bacterium]